MTRDALTGRVPEPPRERCCVCGRWTAAPVVIGYGRVGCGDAVTHHVCPEHVHAAASGPCAAEHSAYRPPELPRVMSGAT